VGGRRSNDASARWPKEMTQPEDGLGPPRPALRPGFKDAVDRLNPAVVGRTDHTLARGSTLRLDGTGGGGEHSGACPGI